MKERNRRWMIIALVGTVGIGTCWLIRKVKTSDPIKSNRALQIWREALVSQYGLDEGGKLADMLDQKYFSLMEQQKFPPEKVLQWHLSQNIFPGFALYQVLLRVNDGNQPAALKQLDGYFRIWTQKKTKQKFGPLLQLPLPFSFFRQAALLQMRSFPASGWDVTYVENSSDRLAMNFTRCFYLDTLTSLGAPELTPSFCKTDEIMAEMFPSSVRLVREHTLGRGDALCDFQYCRGVPIDH